MFDKDRITFLGNGKWKGGGIIPISLRTIDDLSDWIARFLGYCRELGKKYTLFAGGDGALIGQEKASLAEYLEGLVGGLLVFRRYISEGNQSRFESRKSDGSAAFGFEIEESTWQGEGILKTDDSFKLQGFAGWYNVRLLGKLGETFRLYARALADKALTPDEALELAGLVDQVIADTLAVDRMIVTEQVSS